MPKRDDADRIVAQLEALRQAPLNEEERGDVELWQKGRALAQITGYYGWEVALEMLRSYGEQETNRLLSTDPANVDAVRAAHAVAFAANRIFVAFQQDVRNAIEHSTHTPPVVKRGLRGDVPPESL